MKVTGLIMVGALVCISCNAQTKKIVFVCEHGSAKSVLAAAYFNKIAKEKNLPYEAVARGTNPDKEISPKTKQILVQDSIFEKSLVPQKLSQQDVDEAQQVFLFYALPETIQGKGKIQYWLEVESVNGDYAKLRDDIVVKIIPLINRLEK